MLNDNSTVDFSDESARDQLAILELKATYRLMMQTFVLRPQTLVEGMEWRLRYAPNDKYCEVRHCLGREQDEMLHESIINGTFKLLFTGMGHVGELAFIIGRSNGESLERVGTLKIHRFKSMEEAMGYLRDCSTYESVDLT